MISQTIDHADYVILKGWFVLPGVELGVLDSLGIR